MKLLVERLLSEAAQKHHHEGVDLAKRLTKSCEELGRYRSVSANKSNSSHGATKPSS